jgi:hypothetical protein
MPAFIRKVLLFITAYGRLLALLGVGLMVFSFWAQWRAQGDHAYAPREQLQTVTGFVREASEVTVTRKRRAAKTKYYQIDVAPEGGGEPLKLRIRHDVPVEWIENLIEENVIVLYDVDNEVYEAAVEGQEAQLSYEETRDYRIAEAKSTAETSGGALFWVFCVFLTLLGGASFALHRKLSAT